MKPFYLLGSRDDRWVRPRVIEWQLRPSDHGIHPTADTQDFIYNQTLGAAGVAGLWATGGVTGT